ncbi:hypothetical protein J4G08_20110 [Candidatus Poribacteria bacterium]|nr:hypothetical protein [Candidatus Poribacteria bacterium]
MPNAESTPSARMALVAFGVDLAMNCATTNVFFVNEGDQLEMVLQDVTITQNLRRT